MTKRNDLVKFFALSLILILTACGIRPEPAGTTMIEPAHGKPTAAIPALLEPTSTLAMYIPDTRDTGNTIAGFSLPDTPLSTHGPWLAFAAGDGLWALNPDGSGLTHILPLELDGWSYSEAQVSEQRGLVAFLNGIDRYFNLSLTIVSIPEQRVVKRIALTTPETEPAHDVVLGKAMEATRAISDFASFAFSPDGSMLAFMGVIDGPTSDLYVYDLEEDTITRLTDGASQAFSPYWSPDGRYIIHFSAASFGTGAGYIIDGFWAARPDDTGVLSLSEPNGESAEDFIGWLNDNTLLINSWDPGCGPTNLRTFNIDTRNERVLWPNAFSDLVFDEAGGTLAVAIGIDSDVCNPEGRLGVYIIPLDGSPPRQALTTPRDYLAHDDLTSHIIAMQDVMMPVQILPDGRILPINASPTAYGYPILSPDGLWAAWPGKDFWIGRHDPAGTALPELVLSEPVRSVAWSPDSNNVFLFGEDVLYLAYAPDYKPILVAENMALHQAKIFWVTP